ncbi:cyclin-L1-like isoform X2 [Ictalurus furcatus]|uniref:cyclin-L1-like isoform X2 n=1 Tax=Ictalurus furcatus TaxID=66913 RepID=UPI0023507B25|nr:cyclin-L1-like isoform X2 [Ictalurus furcatus]
MSGVLSPSVLAQAPVPGGTAGIVIGDAVYSGVLLAIDSSLVPEEKRSETPSMRDGLELHTETEFRILGCEFIQSAGILLRLPQVAMATGQVLFQRFFYSKSFIKHNFEIVAMACVNLASKIEESPRRVRDVINVFHHLKQGGGKSIPLFLDQNYINTKNQVIKAERRVLKELGFCVHVKHPHKMIVMYLQVLECEKNQILVQTAWNYMNDALRTDVFVRFEPETIACACIYLAARALQIPLPTNPHWFLLFGASESEIRDICISTLKLYSMRKPDIAQLEKEVEKRKVFLEEEKLKVKGVNYSITPALKPNTTFSPASKPGSPKEVKTEENCEEREERHLNSKSPITRIKKVEGGVVQNGHAASRGRSPSPSPHTRQSHSGTYSSPSSPSPSPRQHRSQRDQSRHADRRRRSRSLSDSRGRHRDDGKRKSKSEHWERRERERSHDRGRSRDYRRKDESRTRSSHSRHSRWYVCSSDSPHSNKDDINADVTLQQQR